MDEHAPARYLNEIQVSQLTGRALSTLRNERARGVGMPYIKVGRSIRYDIGDVILFMDSHKIITEGSVPCSGHESEAHAATCIFCPVNPNRKEAAGT